MTAPLATRPRKKRPRPAGVRQVRETICVPLYADNAVPPRRVTLTPGTLLRTWVIAILVLAGALIIWKGRDIVFLAFVSVLFASFLGIFVDPLERLGFSRGAAALITVLGLLLTLAGLWSLAWPTLSVQFDEMRHKLPEAAQAFSRDTASTVHDVVDKVSPTNPRELEDKMIAMVQQEAGSIAVGALPVFGSVFSTLASAAVALMTGFFLTISPGYYLDGLISLVQPRHRPALRDAFVAAAEALRGWIKGTLIGMACIAFLTFLGLWILQIPAAFALGFIAGLLEVIPNIGPISSCIPAMAIALLVSPTKAIAVACLYMAVQFIEAHMMVPFIMNRAVNLPPALMLLFQTLMAVCFGFIGLLVAVPLLAGGVVLVTKLYIEPMQTTAVRDRLKRRKLGRAKGKGKITEEIEVPGASTCSQA